MTGERNTYELITKLHQAETARDDYAAACEELAQDLRTVKEQLHIAERILDERPDLAARYQAAITQAA